MEVGLSHSCQHPNNDPPNRLADKEQINKWNHQWEGFHLSKKLHKQQAINEGGLLLGVHEAPHAEQVEREVSQPRDSGEKMRCSAETSWVSGKLSLFQLQIL